MILGRPGPVSVAGPRGRGHTARGRWTMRAHDRSRGAVSARGAVPTSTGFLDLVYRASGGIDVALVRATQHVFDRASYRTAELLKKLDAMRACEQTYASVDPEQFYAAPPPLIRMSQRPVRPLEGGGVFDLAWPSGYVAHHPEERGWFGRWQTNETVHVRFFAHERPSPAIVLVHGYRGGPFHIEELIWPVSRLYRGGFDVALFTLPFHGLRSPTRWSRSPLFPSNREISRTNEGLGQAIWDLRGLLSWLRGRGSLRVGVAGMSLGGYVAALLATVDPAPDFVVPFIPLSDFADAFVAHQALRDDAVPAELVAAARRSLTLCRPLARRPRIPGERMLVIAGEQDRITGLSQGQSLADHFGASLVTFPGAHVLQVGRGPALKVMERFVLARGLPG
jgi:pimeloyl-ACP methyl ester carboxylesterase